MDSNAERLPVRFDIPDWIKNVLMFRPYVCSQSWSFACRLVVLTVGLLLAGAAQAQDSAKIGTLECFVAEGSGFLVGSSKDISCTLYGTDDEPLENYIGELKKYGVDIGFTRETLLVWSVFVPHNSSYQPGSLAGNFAGASASASVAVGLGASVLIGGLSENFALQPIKLNRQKGVNIAVGITRMELRSIKETMEDDDIDIEEDEAPVSQ